MKHRRDWRSNDLIAVRTTPFPTAVPSILFRSLSLSLFLVDGENDEGRAFDFRIGRLGQPDKEQDKWIPFNPDR